MVMKRLHQFDGKPVFTNWLVLPLKGHNFGTLQEIKFINTIHYNIFVDVFAPWSHYLCDHLNLILTAHMILKVTNHL